MFTIARVLRASEGPMFAIIRILRYFGVGSVGQAPPFGVARRCLAPFDALCFFRGAVPFLPGSGKFYENLDFIEVGPKSAPSRGLGLKRFGQPLRGGG